MLLTLFEDRRCIKKMGVKKKTKYANLEIDALTWGARKAGMSYGRYVSTIEEREKNRVIKAFKKEKNIKEESE